MYFRHFGHIWPTYLCLKYLKSENLKTPRVPPHMIGGTLCESMDMDGAGRTSLTNCLRVRCCSFATTREGGARQHVVLLLCTTVSTLNISFSIVWHYFDFQLSVVARGESLPGGTVAGDPQTNPPSPPPSYNNQHL